MDLSKTVLELPNRLVVKYRGRKVGDLCMDSRQRVCRFQYDRNWLGDGFSISPLDLPLKESLFVGRETPFRGNFGIFEDSLPDGYGRYLLDRILRQNGVDCATLNPLQWLSIVGANGMGALTYEPALNVGKAQPLPQLDEMQRLALEVLGEKSEGDAGVLYYNSGNSGGCRPKCLYRDAEGEWLVKFRHVYDAESIGRMEYEYSLAARECGIHMPPFKLMENKYFASKRFDIDAEGERLHTATAAALLNETIFPPKTDYVTLLRLTGFITQDDGDVEQLYRRMAFNVYAQNKDDHAKNFSFVYDGERWHLGPAYDLTYSPQGYNGEHASSVLYKGLPGDGDMLEAARLIRIDGKRAKGILKEIKEVTESLLQEYLR